MKQLFFLLAALFLVSPVLAQQDVPVIEYGQAVSGEITNRSFEIEYRFSGVAGDVILVEMKPVEGASSLNEPAIMLLDADYNVLQTIDGYSLGALLITQLSTTGDYSVLATRRNGRGGESVGGFMLKLNKLRLMKDGEEIGGKIHPQSVDYYAVETRNPFAIRYERTTRGFYPEVVISTISEYGYGLDEQASLKGKTLVSGAIGIVPETPESGLYIILVQSSSYYGDPNETVEYTLMMDE